MIDQSISDLLTYAELHLGANKKDFTYYTNVLMSKLSLTDIELKPTDENKIKGMDCPDEIIKPILKYAVENGVIEEGEEEFLSSDILDVVSPRPSEVEEKFFSLYKNDVSSAFDYLYNIGEKNDYVKVSAINKNKYWLAEDTEYKIEVTINLSKPEKNNKLTAKLRNVSAGYPKCALCRENVGYVGQGRTRRNMRTIPLELAGEKWFWQYSPYAYFYQHGIAINYEHTPMVMRRSTFQKLLDFVDFAPQYFIGSNAPLPIVGGSILAHEHFQGGKHDFPMFKAEKGKPYETGVEGVKAYLPKWYNSVILLTGENKQSIVEVADRIYTKWYDYSDESVEILSKTDAQHNTLAPIARKTENAYELYLLLRNNRCNEEHPDGIFHAHKEYHNIKSESIGLIEAMGRFILPGRLDKQLAEVEKILTGERTEVGEDIAIHTDMVNKLVAKYGNKLTKSDAHEKVVAYVDDVCENILINTAVFKNDNNGKTAFQKFLTACNITE